MLTKDLKDLSDEQLVELCKQGNREAISILYGRFIGVSRKLTYSYLKEHNIPNLYKDDLFDISIDSFFKAIKKYENSEGRAFLNFWWIVTLRAFATFMKKVITSKIYYYDPTIIEASSYSMSDIIQKEEQLTLSNYFNEILERHRDKFTEKEICFLKYFLAGYKISEIANEMNLTKSSAYRIRIRVINKLNMIIKSN